MQIRFWSPLTYVTSVISALAVLVLCVLGQQEAIARPVTFTWNYTSSGAAGFVLYCGLSSGKYTTRVDVLNTESYTIPTLPEGATSFCAVTAYNSSKVEGPYSNEVAILVQYSVPTVNFSASQTSGAAPLNVAFSNSTAGQVTTWAWDFGDGTTSSLMSPSHVYSTPGNYTVVLNAAGPGGAASKTVLISVGSAGAPAVSFSASSTVGSAPLNVAFTNTTTGQVTTWTWNFGDGTTSSVKSPTHTYSAPGSYSVTLTATGPGGTATKTAATITVSGAPAVPVVNFSASVTSGTAPLSVTFANTTSGSVTNWAWDFGDGTSSPAQNPTHVYTSPGIYRVTLTATGPGGSASKASVTPITINTPASGAGQNTQGNPSLWTSTTVPTNVSAADANPVNLGVKFTSTQSGYITGIRFYKSASNTGTHIGTLWSNTGQKLAQATFTNETASGWQQVTFATPVQINAKTVYVASYFAPRGRYAYNYDYFTTSAFTNGALTALKNGTNGANGLFVYSSGTAFPSGSYRSTNYWVDVIFTSTK